MPNILNILSIKKMRKVLPVTLGLLFCGFEFAQVPEKPLCPKIAVSGPAGIVDPGKTVDFTVQIMNSNDSAKYEYLWTVSSGQIVGGQGTMAISVKMESPYGGTVIATVTVKGLPPGCPNSASDEYSVVIDPGPTKLAEISGPTYDFGKTLLTKM